MSVTDDDPLVVGVKKNPLPHLRVDCEDVLYCEETPAQARWACSKCYCDICETKWTECADWASHALKQKVSTTQGKRLRQRALLNAHAQAQVQAAHTAQPLVLTAHPASQRSQMAALPHAYRRGARFSGEHYGVCILAAPAPRAASAPPRRSERIARKGRYEDTEEVQFVKETRAAQRDAQEPAKRRAAAAEDSDDDIDIVSVKTADGADRFPPSPSPERAGAGAGAVVGGKRRRDYESKGDENVYELPSSRRRPKRTRGA